TLNDIRLQIPGYAKYILSPPYSHGNWGPGDFPQDRTSLFTPRFLFPSITYGNSDSQMGPEYRWQFKEDFSYLMHDWAGTHQWKMGVDYNYITFRADGSSGYAGEWTFPKDQPYNANDSSTWPTQYTQRNPSYADTPVHHFSAYVQDDWEPKAGLIFNLGLRWDVQPGVFNEDIQGRLALIEKKLGPGFGYPLPIP